jgi:hypothetical protein
MAIFIISHDVIIQQAGIEPLRKSSPVDKRPAFWQATLVH